MKLEITIPAVAAAGRDGLDLAVTRLDAPGVDRLLLSAGSGSAILELGPEEGFFMVAHGTARVASAGDEAGRAFVDAVAAWLGLELEDDDAPVSDEATATLECTWARLGGGKDPLGVPWEGYKLFFSLGERYAEVFFRRSTDGARAQLVEKWSEYRQRLVEILERVLAGPRPRRVRPRSTAAAPQRDGVSFGLHGALELDVPEGWLLTEQPGHWRVADPADEMKIEFSYLRLPPLPPEAPGVVERVKILIEDSEYGETASPIQSFERDGATYAWSEYTFDSRDTIRPEAAPRPARGRWLVASNAWIQVLVTGCWWDADRAVAERAWDGLVTSLKLAGRIVPATGDRGTA